jgi:hypothetical protein
MRRMSLTEARKAGPHRRSSAREGIEDPHFDVGVFAQVQEPPVLASGIEIVDEDAHPHTPIRRQAHVMQEDPRRIVLLNDVVLNVQRALGVVGERDEIGQGFLARGQQPDARQALAGFLRRDDAPQRGGLWVRQRLAMGLRDVSRQAGAAGYEHCAERQQGQ